MRRHTAFLSENFKERDHLADLEIYGRILLKWISVIIGVFVRSSRKMERLYWILFVLVATV